MARLFGTDGIRGVFGEDLTEELAKKVGAALARVLGRGSDTKVLIGMDTRESSEALSNAVAEGVCSIGGEAAIIGVCSTPAVAYLVKRHSFDAGIMISASHNPAKYNGIKIFGSDGFKLSDAHEDRIEALMDDPYEVCSGRKYSFANGIDEYVEYLRSSFGVSLKGLKIGVDCANGSASVSAERLLSSLGAECVMRGNTPDGRNINLDCGSTHLDGLKQLVTERKLDLGIAFDGDADRCLAIDREGNEIDGDFIMAIIGLWLKEKGELRDNTIVGTVMSNLGFIKFCEANGLNFVSTKVGDRYVLEMMNERGYDFGGEQSGHLILGRLATTGDGQLTAVALLSCIKERGKSLSALASVMKKYPQFMINVSANAAEKEIFKEDKEISELINEASLSMANRGRVLVRPSGTEPLVRIMTEAEDGELAEGVCLRLAKNIRNRLDLLNKSVRK